MEIRTISGIRTAVVAGRFAEAERLLVGLRDEVEVAWAGASSQDEREHIAVEVGKTLELARSIVLSSRAHDYGKLTRLVSRKEYARRAPLPDIIDLDA